MDMSHRTKLRSLRYISNMRFPIKLYNACESQNILSINWSLNEETSLLIDLQELEIYLKTTTSIFVTNNASQFIAELKKFDFEEISKDNSDPEHIKKFYHQYFLRGKPELLKNITKNEDFNELLKRREIKKSQRLLKFTLQGKFLIDKIRRDLCLNNESTQLFAFPSKRVLLPGDTVSGFEENSDYAGFYGHYDVDAEKVKKFYDEFLPTISTNPVTFGQSQQAVNGDEEIQCEDDSHQVIHQNKFINDESSVSASNYENGYILQDYKEEQISPDEEVTIGSTNDDNLNMDNFLVFNKKTIVNDQIMNSVEGTEIKSTEDNENLELNDDNFLSQSISLLVNNDE